MNQEDKKLLSRTALERRHDENRYKNRLGATFYNNTITNISPELRPDGMELGWMSTKDESRFVTATLKGYAPVKADTIPILKKGVAFEGVVFHSEKPKFNTSDYIFHGDTILVQTTTENYEILSRSISEPFANKQEDMRLAKHFEDIAIVNPVKIKDFVPRVATYSRNAHHYD